MPKVTVNVPHDRDPKEMIEKAGPVLEKTVKDFEGHDLNVEWSGQEADFTFKSLGFTIRGKMVVEAEQVLVELDLPFAAMMYKEKAKKGITKNITAALAN